MSILEILEALFIGPLKIVFEFIFQIADTFVDNPGISIIFLSLTMNILVLPLYKRADAMQEEARDIEMKLHDGVAHIKKSFSGDEKMMILQAYYRQNNYKPTQALRGSVSLLLEIPFFMAAYQFLSNLGALNGASLGPIADLGKPDGLIVIGGFAINLLPILMTLINVISSAIYLKGFPLKTKIQLYGMAAFFLVFLYTSPSGLVFYWTLNNLFSLVKTIFYKLKNPKKVLNILCSVVGLATIVFGAFIYKDSYLPKKLLVVALGLALEMPLALSIISSKLKGRTSGKKPAEPNKKLFLFGSIFLTLLVGGFIPSTYIASSPEEFVDLTAFVNPLWYLLSSLCLAAGLFLVWMRVFYWLATDKGKVVFDRVVVALCGVMTVNYVFFGRNLGVVSSTLYYETGVSFSLLEQVINVAVITAVAVLLWFFAAKLQKFAMPVVMISALALGAVTGFNAYKTFSVVSGIDRTTEDRAHFSLSKDGQNVVVLMLDRGVGEYMPYFINEKPEMKEIFDGFTYYSNIVSFGGHTNFGLPPLVGGYEYTPVEMNKREDESLQSKHDEALKVLPVLFDQNDYEVTVCDPPYAGYKQIPDLTIFDEYEDINTYITKGTYASEEQVMQLMSNNKRNFFCFSLMKTMPVSIQPAIYDSGEYRRAATVSEGGLTSHKMIGLTKSTGFKKSCMDWYQVLLNLDEMTNIVEGDTNTYLFMNNEASHEIMYMQEPEYVPAATVDNTKYEEEHADRYTVDGKTLIMEDKKQMASYQTNMAVLLRIGEWLQYLKDNDVYDNTKIIIVSDHGYSLFHDENLIFGETRDIHENAEFYFPLLLVKDFGSTGFTVNDEFMTNADVPTIVTDGLIENPLNPFTGNPINSDEKTAHEQCVILSNDHNVSKNHGNQYNASRWASISGDIHNRDNWHFGANEEVLTEHQVN